MGGKIIISEGDITRFKGEAIVNAANTDLILGSGVAGAIREAGGPMIQEECNRHGPIKLGEAAITGGGNLSAKYVIHAASMSFSQLTTAESLENSVINSLKIAEERGIKTVAFPAIGTGVAGFPVARCAQIMIRAVCDFLEKSSVIEEVHFILFDKTTREAFESAYESRSH